MFYKLFLSAVLLCISSNLSGAIIPIVTAEENSRLEELAEETGANEWRFMTNAGMAVSLEAERMIDFRKDNKITVLVGKGYNGGNALWAALLLKQKGYDVTAYRIFPSNESPLICQEVMDMFKQIGGDVQAFDAEMISNADLIIDGIVGASFKGRAKGTLANAIHWANTSKRPILSVDIPSGLNGETGEVGTVAIRAQRTVTFFFPRIGFFIQEGWNYVGTLCVVNLGLHANILSQIHPKAYLVSSEESSKYLQDGKVLKLDRMTCSSLMGFDQERTLEDYQEFSEKNKTPILFTDSPMMLIEPSKAPIFFGETSLYKFTDSNEIQQIFDFLEE